MTNEDIYAYFMTLLCHFNLQDEELKSASTILSSVKLFQQYKYCQL